MDVEPALDQSGGRHFDQGATGSPGLRCGPGSRRRRRLCDFSDRKEGRCGKLVRIDTFTKVCVLEFADYCKPPPPGAFRESELRRRVFATSMSGTDAQRAGTLGSGLSLRYRRSRCAPAMRSQSLPCSYSHRRSRSSKVTSDPVPAGARPVRSGFPRTSRRLARRIARRICAISRTCQPAARGQVELRLEVALGEEQHAMRRLSVASRTSRLLQVVLDGPGDLPTCTTNRTLSLSIPMPKALVATITGHFAGDERVLNPLLVGGIQAVVEVLDVPCSRSKPCCEFPVRISCWR